MKKYIKYICFALAISLCLASPAFAAEINNSRASQFFWSSSVYLYKTSSTSFQAWFEVECFGLMDDIGASEIKIQRSSDGQNWTTVKTYTKDTYSNMIDHNTAGHASYVTYTGTLGYYYRACIILYAKNSSGVGEMTEYTSTLRLQ